MHDRVYPMHTDCVALARETPMRLAAWQLANVESARSLASSRNVLAR